jgi:Leucine-rich repeat (LRR) protein
MQEANIRIANWIELGDTSRAISLDSLGLTELPKIPSNCVTLSCSNNKLTVLPELPNCQILNCCGNQLTALPELPACWMLFCENNQLAVLPELPNYSGLYCSNNKYLWITRQQSIKYHKYHLEATPNYTKFAKIIQHNYRKYIIRKYKPLDKYLLRDTIKVVCLYI